MSKADEMFKKLGFEEIEKYNNGISYYRDNDLEEDEIEFIDYENIGKTVNFNMFSGITMQELQAINEKVKELGWLDE